MALCSSPFVPNLVNRMRYATVKISYGGPTAGTGTVIGAKDGKSIILTLAHIVRGTATLDEAQSRMRVHFYKDTAVDGCHFILFLPKPDIMLLLVDKETSNSHKLSFAPKNEWDLMDLQILAAVAHPSGHAWRIQDGKVCFPEYLAPYEPEMVCFEHGVDLTMGCTGAALVNERGNLVGVHVGGFDDTYHVMGTSLTSYAKEELNLAEVLRDLSIDRSGEEFRRTNLVQVKVPSSGIKFAIHVKYISKILQEETSRASVRSLQTLQKDIEDCFIHCARSSTASSSR